MHQKNIVALSTLLDHSHVAIIATDHAHTILFINEMSRRLFAVDDTATALNTPLAKIITNTEVQELFLKTTAANPNSRSELILTDSKHVLSIQITAVPDSGKIAIMQDITHLKELDRVKSAFVERASNDIRSPLTTILGHVELLEMMGPINEQQKTSIERIAFSVHSITQLLTDLLELNRIEADFSANQESIRLAMIIQYVLDSKQQQIAHKPLRLTADIQERAATIAGQPLRLRIMINNLLDNAIKYTPADGTIQIALNTQEDFLLLTITDSGIGIPLQDQPHIFEKFYRGHNITQHYPGAGLGLSMVKNIVEQHNGRIWMESQESSGTTFTIMLPIQNGQG
ncbi:sensor histidine kinase [Chloroflexota bacterium]